MVLGPETTGPAGPEGPGGKKEISREFREHFERGGGAFPIGGQDIIEELQSTEIGENGDTSELEKAVFRTLAYREGLGGYTLGEPYRFNPENITDPQVRQKVAPLENLFITVEGATQRPSAVYYIDIALDEALTGRVRRAENWKEDEKGWESRTLRRLIKTQRVLNIERERPLSNEEIEAVVASQVREKKEEFEREYAAIPKLIELQNHVSARRIFDTALLQRMVSCEDPGKAGALGSSEFPAVTPDGTHFLALFRQDKENEVFGQKVNEVFEEMVKFALPNEIPQRLGMTPIPEEIRKQVGENPYANGFDSAKMFAYWLSYCLKKADGRMDVVWNAWKLMLTLEVADKLGETVDKKKDVWVLATPPIGNSLMTFCSHLEKKRAIEFGLKAKGDQRTNQVEKFVSHSGLPMSLGKFKDPQEDYLHEAKVEFDQSYKGEYLQVLQNLYRNLPKPGAWEFTHWNEYKNVGGIWKLDYYNKLNKDLDDWLNARTEKIKVSLWDLWLYGRLGFADRKFPWRLTQQEDATKAPGELPPGTFGFWLLQRQRLGGKEGVLSDIRSRPPVQDLGDPDFFPKKLRNWAKVLGTIKDVPKGDPDYLEPEENSRAWWVMGILRFHLGGTRTKSPITTAEPLRDYRTLSRSQEVSTQGVAAESRSPTVGDVLNNAVVCGFLRQEDSSWIREELGISLM